MNNVDIREALPILAQFGVTPESLGPEKLEQLIDLTKSIKSPTDITPQISRHILDIIGIRTNAPKPPIKRKFPKVGRNDFCCCGSEKKYKKCCGKC